MDWKVQTSSSNNDFGNREKKETKFVVGNLGKVAVRSNENIFFEKTHKTSQLKHQTSKIYYFKSIANILN